jgi:hypothetical protein
MDIQEFEQRLHDAEVRLARLKALYEQWFQGIERIEPTIARKELERALEALRREQPRNTALRFRFQQLSARYGTYGIYWGRIAKQIEDGTYRRDLQRIKDRQQRKKESARQEAIELDVDIDDFDAFGDSDLDAILGALSDTPTGPPPASAPAGAPKTFGKRRDEPTTEPAPPPEAAPATQPAPPPTGPTRTAGPVPPRAPAGPAPTAVPPPPPIAAAALSGRPPPPGAPPRPPVPAPVPAPSAAPGPPPSGPIAIGRMVRQASATPATGGVREEMGTHSRTGRPGAVPGAVPAAAPVASGAPRAFAPPPGAPRPPVAAAPPHPAAPQATGPDMKALYDRYVEARRRNNERIDNVKFESLQQSVEKMMPKLREKHGAKPIDFEVVVQDGKVGLKPKVRG